jgi:hypothetical protein
LPRDPNISIRTLIDPIAVVGELIFVIRVVRREIGPAHGPGIDGVAALVPVAEVVAPRNHGRGFRRKTAVNGDDLLALFDQDRALFAGRFGRAAIDAEFGILVVTDIHPIQSRFHDVKRCVRSMDLETLFPVEAVDSDEEASGKEMDFGRIGIALGKGYNVHLGEIVQAEVVSPAELNLQASVFRPELVALDDDEVHLALLITLVLAALDIDVAFDVAHARITSAVISLVLSESDKGKNRQ